MGTPPTAEKKYSHHPWDDKYDVFDNISNKKFITNIIAVFEITEFDGTKNEMRIHQFEHQNQALNYEYEYKVQGHTACIGLDGDYQYINTPESINKLLKVYDNYRFDPYY